MSDCRYIYAHEMGNTPSDAYTGPYFSTYELADAAMRRSHPEWQPEGDMETDEAVSCAHRGVNRGTFSHCDRAIGRYPLDEAAQ